MEINKISGYSDFLSIVEYPAVIFCEDGEVLSVNNAALKIIGSIVNTIKMEPDKFMTSDNFWPTLEAKKAIIWHRLKLIINNSQKYVVSGFVNQFEYGDKKAYMVLFELRSDVSIGSVSLEKIVNHIGAIAMYLYKPDNKWTTRYISKNISDYGYTDANFYSGQVSLQDILVKSDYDILVGQMYKAFHTGADDFEMDVRLKTVRMDLSKMCLKCHMVRTADGSVDGIELLFIKENHGAYDEEGHAEYILSAMTKIKSFVMVQKYDHKIPILEYITPNAKQFGLNLEALKNGDKLVEDYIHPKDRARVLNNVREAIYKEEKEYEEELRIVNDSGKIIWVKSQSSVTQSSDGIYTVEYFITDITDKKELEDRVEQTKKDFDNKLSYIMKANVQEGEEKYALDVGRWTEVVKMFARVSGLYTTVIDPAGNRLIEPVGPDRYMGAFYDLFERPQYREIYIKLNEALLRNNVPVIMDMDDGIDGSKICGAPIIMDGIHVATWICCSYDEQQADKIKELYKEQWQLCRLFSESDYNSNILAKEAIRSKSIEILMNARVQWQKNLLDSIKNSDRDGKQIINDIICQVGESLEADVAAVYVKDEVGDLNCEYFWSKGQTMSASEYVAEWQRANKRFRLWLSDMGAGGLPERGFLIVDEKHIDDESARILMDSPVKSFEAVPLFVNGEYDALIVLANASMGRLWTADEVDFTEQAAGLIQGCLERMKNDRSVMKVNKVLLDTYNYVSEGIFIREKDTGKVLFSNNALNDMLGYDFVGKDSKLLIKDLRDKYSYMGSESHQITNNDGEVKWRSYIGALDSIMDLTEVNMKWLDGSNVSLVILRDVVD
jgi:PAS domain S-box-containing protein